MPTVSRVLPRFVPAQPSPGSEPFLSLTRLSSDWYWETDEASRLSFVSEGLQRVFGVDAEDPLGKTMEEPALGRNDPGLRPVAYERGQTYGIQRAPAVTGSPAI